MGFNPNDFVGSGLWDGGRATFRNVRFTRIPEYRDGQDVLMLADLATDDPEVGTAGVLEDQRFGMGKGWVNSDDDKAVTEHEDGKKLKLNDATALGRFVASLAKQTAWVDAMQKRWEDGQEDTPFTAAMYEGLDVTISQHSKDFQINGETATQRYFEVDEFHGYVGEGDGGKAKAAKAPAKKATAAKKATKKATAAKVEAEEAEENPTDGLDEKVLAAIRAVADASDSFEDYIAGCYADIAEVGDDPRYAELVEADGEGSIWAIAVAEYEAANS